MALLAITLAGISSLFSMSSTRQAPTRLPQSRQA